MCDLQDTNVPDKISKLLLTAGEQLKIKLGNDFEITVRVGPKTQHSVIHSSSLTSEVCDEGEQTTKSRSLKVFKDGGYLLEYKSATNAPDEAPQSVAAEQPEKQVEKV